MARVTLQDIADALHVTRATVSLALRSHPSISKKTRLKVMECAQRLGYRPNPLISALMADLRTHGTVRTECTLAYITAYSDDDLKVTPAAKRYYEGAKECAHARGYKLEYFHYSAQTLSEARLSKILFSRGIPGALISPCRPPVTSLSFPWEHLSVATLGYTLQSPIIHRSVNHQFRTLNLALRKAQEYGYKRLGLLTSNDANVEHLWQAGFLYYQASQPVRQRIPIALHPLRSTPQIRAWIDKYRPDAVIVPSYPWLEGIRQAGYRVPEDVAVIVLDRSEEHVDAAGIDQRPDLVGAMGIDIVIQGIITNSYGIPAIPRTVMIDGEWVDGSSLPRKQ